MPNIYHLIYTSETPYELAFIDIENLVKHARFNNFIHQVTGLLIYAEQHFIQVLEGKKENVELIFEKILVDKRHNNIKIVQQNFITQRAFSNWNIGLTILSKYPELKKSLAQRNNVDNEFSLFSNYEASFIIEQFSHDKFRQFID